MTAPDIALRPLDVRLRSEALARPRLSASHLRATHWLLASLGAALLALVFQVRQRAGFLVWDEADRIYPAVAFAHAVHVGDPAGAWAALHIRSPYPVLASLTHGLILLLNPDPVVAAWVPSVVAYAVAGLLVARLTLALSGKQWAAWCAALLFWMTPLELRVTAGSFIEPMGGCLYLALLLSLVRLQQLTHRRSALWPGLLVAVAWLYKYDYGVLASALVGLSGALTDR